MKKCMAFLLVLTISGLAQMNVKNSGNQVLLKVTETGEVGIGTTSPDARLRLHGSSLTTLPYAVGPTQNDKKAFTSIHAEHLDFPSSSNPNIYVAMQGAAKAMPASAYNYSFRSAVHGVLINNSTPSNWTVSGAMGFQRTGQNYLAGVIGTVNSAPIGHSDLKAIAGYFWNANATDAAENWTVYAEGDRNYFSGQVGIGGTPYQTHKLSVFGTAYKNDGSQFWSTTSDLRLKDVVGDYTTGLETICQLHPIVFHYKKDNELGLLSESEHIGLGAQDLAKVLPEAVSQDGNGYLTVNANPILYSLINSIKELKAQNEALQKRIARLENTN